MSSSPFAAILATPAPAGSAEAGWQAAATLYHAYFTGLILTVASRAGAAAAGEWTFRVFRRQHEEKFLASFDKLGLAGLPHAVAAARYHYLSNSIGGVEVEYMEESDRKAWVRFCHPRWLYEGAALCAVPLEVSHGFLRGWYGHNGVSLGNPRLGFVCTSQDMTAQYGLAGYFREFDRPLAPDERVQFAPDEEPPPFDPACAPRLDPAAWPAARLRRAHRNYAMDYVRTGLPALVALRGPAEAGALGNLAGQLIGRQYYRQVRGTLGVTGAGAEGFADVLAALGTAHGDRSEVRRDGDAIVVTQQGWTLMRGQRSYPGVFDAWNGLWEGCLAAHDRTLVLDVRRRPDDADPLVEWVVRSRRRPPPEC